MRKRVITAAVGVVGLVVIGLGVASATVWRADDVLVATTTSSTQLVVTDPGVLEVGGDPATVRVTAPGGAPVVLAVGRDYDVDGWVGDDAYTRVTGLASWDALATTAGTPAAPTSKPSTQPSGDPSPEPGSTSSATTSPTASPKASPSATSSPRSSARPSPSASATAAAGGTASEDEPVISPDPTDSDMWFAQETGDGSATLVWPTQPGRWSLLVASAGDATPTLSISWPRVVTTPWLWPCVVIGSLMVLVSGLLLLRGRAAARPATWESVHTGAVPVVTGAGTGQALTRRQLREAEQASRRTGQIPRVTTGATPTVTSTVTAPTRAASTVAGGTSPAGTRPDERVGTSTRSDGPSSTPAAHGRTTSAPAAAGPAGPVDAPRVQGPTRPPTAPVSRRALRSGPPTGQIGVVPPASSTARPGAASAPGASAPGASGPGASGPGASGPAPSSAATATPGAASSAPTAPTASVTSAAPARGGVADGERHRPSWLGGAAQHTPPASPGASPAGTSNERGGPAAAGGWVPGAPSAGPDAPTTHGGPPSWAHPPLPGAPTAAWSPNPGPASGPHRPDAPRPTAPPGRAPAAPQPTGPGVTPPPSAAGATPVPAAPDPSAGSRADAWRRAWGLPPTALETSDGAQGDDEGSER